ncbi:MAG: hypothetical protein GX565_01010 [Lentisphaerae bacterium]|nr:hypothetical protein [Lentisphaerota bacterium]
MKTYKQLNAQQKARAREKALNILLTDICEQRIQFNNKLIHDDLQKRIDEAGAKAEKMQTPWFWHEYILDTCREDLESMALRTAEDALYPEPGEHIIRGVL